MKNIWIITFTLPEKAQLLLMLIITKKKISYMYKYLFITVYVGDLAQLPQPLRCTAFFVYIKKTWMYCVLTLS